MDSTLQTPPNSAARSRMAVSPICPGGYPERFPIEMRYASRSGWEDFREGLGRFGKVWEHVATLGVAEDEAEGEEAEMAWEKKQRRARLDGVTSPGSVRVQPERAEARGCARDYPWLAPVAPVAPVAPGGRASHRDATGCEL